MIENVLQRAALLEKIGDIEQARVLYVSVRDAASSDQTVMSQAVV
jgi:hypothetical protein